MLNYNLNMEDDDKFVCYYERGIMYTKDDNDKICSKDVLVLHMGDEGIVYIPNTRENEVVVLNKIRSQMLKYKDQIGEIKKTLLDAEIVKYGSFFSMSASLMYALTRFKEGQIILGLILVIFAYLSHNVWRYYANLGVVRADSTKRQGAIKQLNGSNQQWWLRSALSISYGNFRYVNYNGSSNDNIATSAYGVAPAFRIG